MIWAAIELYKISNEAKYLAQAAQLLRWYMGNNPANQKIYDKSTGVCFDGISSSMNLNKNCVAVLLLKHFGRFNWPKNIRMFWWK